VSREKTREKRSSLLAVLLVAWLVGQAPASPFTLDKYDATLLRQVSISDVGHLITVADSDGVVHWTDGTFPLYGASMQGVVGYLGRLYDSDGDSLASIRIGAMGTAALGDIQTAGSYDGFRSFFANDDDDPWGVRLYMEAGGTSYSSGFVMLPSGASSILTLDFGATIDFAQVRDIGFEVQGHFVPGSKPSNPDFFHISVAPVSVPVPIPVPGAGLLSLLGVGIVGWIRRSRRM
jgi:hypothetical protein